MQDIIDKLAADISRTTVETCAKVAEIHHRSTVGGEVKGSYLEGYNQAVRDVAAKIRELNKARARVLA